MSVSTNRHENTSVRIASNSLLASVLSLWGALLIPHSGHAMSPEQLKSLAGASLLDMRVDALFQQCGLPTAIVDTADASHERQTLRWKQAEMSLSRMKWVIHYSHQPPAAGSSAGWRNPAPVSAACLSELASLILHAKGEAGFLTVRKREDNKGYITTYTIPDNLYRAHQIVGIAGSWKRGVPVSGMKKVYGAPDEIFKRDGKVSIHRYWIVHRENQMPLSAHAVDFEIGDTEKTCSNYAVYTSGVEFVQEKLDALIREWERAYVLD